MDFLAVISVGFLKMLTKVNILARVREAAVLAFEFKGLSQEPIGKALHENRKIIELLGNDWLVLCCQ